MSQEMTKVFETPEGCDLVVKNIQGIILVKGWDRPQTEVLVVKHKDGVEVEMHQDGRKVVIETKQDNDGLGGILNWLSGKGVPTVDYTVHVPYNSNVKLSNVSGPITVTEIEGTVRTENVDGPTKLHSVHGKVKANTVNGSLKTVDLEGEVKLNAVNGELKVKGGRLSGLKAEAVNGKIDVSAAFDPAGCYAFHTVNGSCHLRFAAGLRARVSVKGLNTHVSCDLPTEEVEKHFGSWTGIVGQGDGPLAKVSFDTVNGHLHILGGEKATGGEKSTADETVPFVAKAETQEAPAEPVVVKVVEKEAPSQAQVLKMVEQGEIGVEEALKLLKGE